MNLNNLENNIFAGERFDSLINDIDKSLYITTYNISLTNDIETLQKVLKKEMGSPFIQTLVPKPRRPEDELTSNIK